MSPRINLTTRSLADSSLCEMWPQRPPSSGLQKTQAKTHGQVAFPTAKDLRDTFSWDQCWKEALVTSKKQKQKKTNLKNPYIQENVSISLFFKILFCVSPLVWPNTICFVKF